MQTKSNSDQLITEKELNKKESSLKEQLQKKAAIQKRVIAYLNTSKT